MSTLKTGHYKKDYHELVTTSFVYYIVDFEMKKRAELDDVANNSALFIGNWICKLLYGHVIQQK